VAISLTAMTVSLMAAAPFSTYICLDDSVFTLSTTDEMAIVRFKDGEYRLPRRRSSLAVKYATEQATLFLDFDGEFAAFVADDRPLPGCHRKEAKVGR